MQVTHVNSGLNVDIYTRHDHPYKLVAMVAFVISSTVAIEFVCSPVDLVLYLDTFQQVSMAALDFISLIVYSESFSLPTSPICKTFKLTRKATKNILTTTSSAWQKSLPWKIYDIDVGFGTIYHQLDLNWANMKFDALHSLCSGRLTARPLMIVV